jgi:transcriptional regulator with GAF, ATPase, and Fis domain
VAVSCSALPETLLESELFGHTKGAFTGATRARRGYFELAHGGTIFLDEIAELPPHLQVKLLRVLEERRIQPLGSERPIAVDVRVLAATNRDLEIEVGEKRFRTDLFYRLNVVSLTLPPLRERREDIPELLQSYIDHFRARLPSDVATVHPDALEALTAYDWPGNVRELINVVERAVLMARGSAGAGPTALGVPFGRRSSRRRNTYT